MRNRDLPRVQNSQEFMAFSSPVDISSKTAAGISGEVASWTSLVGMGTGIVAVPIHGRRLISSLIAYMTGADGSDFSVGIWGAWRGMPFRGAANPEAGEAWRGRRLGVLAVTGSTDVIPTTAGYEFYRGSEASSTVLRYADTMTWTADEYFSNHLTDVYGAAAYVYDVSQNGGNANEAAELALTDIGDMEALVFDVFDADSDAGKVNLLINLGF